ncbi:MAG: hypothetical protein ACI84R_003846, partial [Candidatus Azotimanducaceae bacterium]
MDITMTNCQRYENEWIRAHPNQLGRTTMKHAIICAAAM